MKLFLQNLLILFALSLCALISFQWVRETDLRRTVQKLTDTVQDKTDAIRGLQAADEADKKEIQRLDTLKNQFTAQLKSNAVEIVTLHKDLDKNGNDLERTRTDLNSFKDALERANENIKRQNEDILKQNQELKKLSEDRNEVVKKFNKMAADYNELAAKWNEQQEQLRKQATNAPPPAPSKK